jgi:hypothetical protein
MANAEHDKFGTAIGGARWFNGEPAITETPMVPVQLRWLCPIDDCGGEMKFNGMVWPTGQPGYHHSCDKCGFTAAVHGKFPRVEYRPAGVLGTPEASDETRNGDTK